MNRNLQQLVGDYLHRLPAITLHPDNLPAICDDDLDPEADPETAASAASAWLMAQKNIGLVPKS